MDVFFNILGPPTTLLVLTKYVIFRKQKMSKSLSCGFFVRMLPFQNSVFNTFQMCAISDIIFNLLFGILQDDNYFVLILIF